MISQGHNLFHFMKKGMRLKTRTRSTTRGIKDDPGLLRYEVVTRDNPDHVMNISIIIIYYLGLEF